MEKDGDTTGYSASLSHGGQTFTNTGSAWVANQIIQATDFYAVSDRRIKKNFRPLRNALDKIRQVKIHRYNLIADETEGIGVIAQELQEIMPEAVAEGDTMSVRYNYLFSTLVQAVQELADKVDGLTK